MQFGDLTRFHFVGLGGSGMSALAEILLDLGCEVSGSDLAENAQLRHLRSKGAGVFLGHRPENLAGAQVVVYSTAVPADNPEVEAARRAEIPVIHRSELLAELMRHRQGIAVAGTHGKTTTTAMLGSILRGAGLDPTLVVGARLPALGSNACLGRGPHVVAEADESDGSFLRLPAVYAVVTNVDRDHLDHFSDFGEIQEAFVRFMNQVPFYGWVVACHDDPGVLALRKKVHRRVLTYGLKSGADLSLRELQLLPLGSRYDCLFRGEALGRIELCVPGAHNALNSLAAVTVARLLEVPFPAVQAALRAFRGAERRLESKGERGGVWVMDDYAHHPAEIRTTLEACRRLERRIVAVFQPHRYSRTLHLLEEWGPSFEGADLLFVTEIYGAGEKPIPGATGARLAEAIGRHRPVHFVPESEQLISQLRSLTRAGDLLLTLGAGNVWKIGEAFLEENIR